MWFMLNTCLSFGILKFWYVISRGCLHEQTPIKMESLMIFSSRKHLHDFFYNSLLQELSTVDMTPLGKDSWWLVPGFLQMLHNLPFPVADFALNLFIVIILSHVYNNLMLSPLSYFSDLPSLVLVWGHWIQLRKIILLLAWFSLLIF